jgi:hypothetical protein
VVLVGRVEEAGVGLDLVRGDGEAGGEHIGKWRVTFNRKVDIAVKMALKSDGFV